MPRRRSDAHSREEPPPALRVAVVDGREAMRTGLCSMLRELGYLPLLAVATGEELMAACRAGTVVDLALVHVRLAGLDGIATLGLLHRKYPQLRTVALCAKAEEEMTARAVRAEALAVLLEGVCALDLGVALADAGAGRLHANALVKQAVVLRARPPKRAAKGPRLTPRETEILLWAAHWARLPVAGIARRIGAKPNTVKGHLKAIREKLGVSTTGAAVVRAVRWGLMPELTMPG